MHTTLVSGWTGSMNLYELVVFYLAGPVSDPMRGAKICPSSLVDFALDKVIIDVLLSTRMSSTTTTSYYSIQP